MVEAGTTNRRRHAGGRRRKEVDEDRTEEEKHKKSETMGVRDGVEADKEGGGRARDLVYSLQNDCNSSTNSFGRSACTVGA